MFLYLSTLFPKTLLEKETPHGKKIGNHCYVWMFFSNTMTVIENTLALIENKVSIMVKFEV